MPSAIAVLGSAIVMNETPDSPKMTDNNGRTIVRTFILECADPETAPFTETDALILELKPLNQPGGRYPAANSPFYVTGFTFEPFSQQGTCLGGLTGYSEWKVTVTYKALKFKRIDNPVTDEEKIEQHLEINTEGSGFYETLPGTDLYWSGQDVPTGDEEIDAALLVSTTEYSVTKHHYPLEYLQTFFNNARPLRGRVNKEAFPANHPVFPSREAETVMFKGESIRLIAMSDGELEAVVTLRFEEIGGLVIDATAEVVTRTWNHVWHRNTILVGGKWVGAYDKLYFDTTTSAGGQNRPLYRDYEIDEINTLLIVP